MRLCYNNIYMNYKDCKIESFINLLKSNESMPGGGTASALVSAMGVSLILMVINLSIEKEKYKEHKELLQNNKNQLEEYNNRLLILMDEDAINFKQIENVFKIKPETEKEKEDKKIKMSDACKKCCEVPKEIIKISKEIYSMIDNLYEKTTKSAESDLNVAKIFLKAGIKGANENIIINKKYIIN